MSHPAQREFLQRVKQRYPNDFSWQRVLEIGSLNINGTARDFFDNCAYTGVDVGAGACVDIVCLGHETKFLDETFDVVLSCECFEHNPHWASTFFNMIRQCRRGGLIIMTCATTGRAEHGTARTTPQDAPLVPWDYYQNLTESDIREQFALDHLFTEYEISVDDSHHDLCFAGRRA